MLTERGPVGKADCGPKLHKGLVKIPGTVQGHDGAKRGGESLFGFRLCHVGVKVSEAGDHPEDVAVHGGLRNSKSDGGDSPGGIVPHSGKGTDGGVRMGELPAVLFGDHLGRLLEITGPGVIAQSLPQLHQRILGTLGQSFHRREDRQETAVMIQHGGHPGLLQHDLRDPYMVRGRVTPPGKDPGIFPVPFQQRYRQLFQLVHSPSPLSFFSL